MKKIVLVTGGAYCGKTHFINEKFLPDENISVISNLDGLCKDKLVKLKDGYNSDELIDSIIADASSKDILIIEAREIGAGIVPADKFDRNYRDKFGELCNKIAGMSDEVYRVVCGIGIKIK